MEMSPITEYSEVGGFFLQNLQIRNLMLNELRQSIVWKLNSEVERQNLHHPKVQPG